MDKLVEWTAIASPATVAVLPRALRASRFLGRVFARHPAWTRNALAAGAFEHLPEQAVATRLRATLADSAADSTSRSANQASELMRALRVFRNRELARIAFRDIAGWAPLDETLVALSALADACCAAAIKGAAELLERRGHRLPGDAPCKPIVLGMGKLGGRELNFSSDVDLIFAYGAAAGAQDARGADVAEYFDRLAREAARLLASVTEDGFVYRVDTLLRPFGSAGAAALSVPAMEAYYQNHGREWERYALIKARPVAGDEALGRSLLDALQPFVYRRYLDYDALGALRELKARIDADARRRGAQNDIKLGSGGIRELEFVVQLFQLVRGGQDARLRNPSLRVVLRYLGESGLLPGPTVRNLDQAYVLLRRCENAIQYHDDAQRHSLPADASEREALCAALDMDWNGLDTSLTAARHAVRDAFERLFAGPPPASVRREESLNVLWTAEADELEAALRARGYETRPTAVVGQLMALRESRLVRSLGDAALSRLRGAVSQLVVDAVAATATGSPDPETALIRALQVVVAIGGRSTYLTLLRESPTARAQLLRLVAASPWIASLLAQTPALLDTLLDPQLATEAPGRETLHADLAAIAAGLDATDTEASMELLRRYRQETMLRIAAADLSGSLPLVQVSDRLTWLAEAVLQKAVHDARLQLAARYGHARNADGSSVTFTAIAYGKFGSIELGYGSDLDLVFVYDAVDPARETVEGQRCLSIAEYCARLGQRIVQLLSAMTGAGRAYEIDLQLRPSGGSGAVVTSLAAWSRYQRESAWTWEHQALLRARPVSGDAVLGAAVEAVRRAVLTRPRDAETLCTEVREMRDKMRGTLERHEPGLWDVKQGGGGLVDAEFLVQFLVLRDAAQRPELVEYTDNWRQLDALCYAGILAVADAQALMAAGRGYRNWLHRRALQEADGLAGESLFVDERRQVTRLWNRYLAPPTD